MIQPTLASEGPNPTTMKVLHGTIVPLYWCPLMSKMRPSLGTATKRPIAPMSPAGECDAHKSSCRNGASASRFVLCVIVVAARKKKSRLGF